MTTSKFDDNGRICNACKTYFAWDNFYSKSKNGSLSQQYHSRCKSCHSEAMSAYNASRVPSEEAKAKKNASIKLWKAKNREKVLSHKQAYRDRHSKKIAESTRQWKRNNHEKWSLNKELRATRAKQARVSWNQELTQLVMIEAIDVRKRREKITGIKWHIDHIIPLKGDLVCGLHVWNNIAVIPAVTNISKSNRFDLDC